MIKAGLHSYASGDGALHFCISDANGQATGQKVTRKMAERHLARKDNRHLLDTGWFAMNDGNYWYMVKRLERVGPNRLRMLEKDWQSTDGGISFHEYGYNVTEKDVYGEVRDYGLSVTAETPEDLVPAWGKTFEVKNISIRAVIRYYLSHEAAIEKWIVDAKVPTLEATLQAPTARFIGAGI